MSRKDYVLIARALRNEYDHHVANDSPSMAVAVRGVAEALAGELRATNGQFDRSRFLMAALGSV